MGESIFKATWKSPFYNDILLCYPKSYYIQCHILGGNSTKKVVLLITVVQSNSLSTSSFQQESASTQQGTLSYSLEGEHFHSLKQLRPTDSASNLTNLLKHFCRLQCRAIRSWSWDQHTHISNEGNPSTGNLSIFFFSFDSLKMLERSKNIKFIPLILIEYTKYPVNNIQIIFHTYNVLFVMTRFKKLKCETLTHQKIDNIYDRTTYTHDSKV